MSEKFLCPRLADYLVIVGSRSPHHSAIQPPELLRRYPLDDHKVSFAYYCFILHFLSSLHFTHMQYIIENPIENNK